MYEPSTMLTQLSTSQQNASRTRPGPKPKLIRDRILKPSDIIPIRFQQRTWSQQQKVRALVFLYHHRIPVEIVVKGLKVGTGDFRCPTQIEASDLFGVPQRTLSDWVRKQDTIESLAKFSSVRTLRTFTPCRWPDLETRLYRQFLERGEKGQAVRRGWFRVHAEDIFKDLFPEAETSVFRFSNGWFSGFLG